MLKIQETDDHKAIPLAHVEVLESEASKKLRGLQSPIIQGSVQAINEEEMVTAETTDMIDAVDATFASVFDWIKL